MSSGPKVFVILPVHNRWEQTRRCLGLLAEQSHGGVRVVLVDDGSTDGTREFVKRDFPGVTVLDGDGTLWWAGGVNRGLDFAMRESSPADFLLILNNDLAFDGNFVAGLFRESIERGRAALFPPSVDNRTGEPADTGLIVDWKGVRIVSAHHWDKEGPLPEPDAVSTRGLLLPVSVVAAAGRLREKELPHYLSDIEYTLRIKAMGLPLYRSLKVTASLDLGTTGIRVTPGMGSPWREVRDHLFDYRSPSNIVHWLRFLRICCPKRYMPRWILSILVAEMKFAGKAFLRGTGSRA